jgi:hypothetical protein
MLTSQYLTAKLRCTRIGAAPSRQNRTGTVPLSYRCGPKAIVDDLYHARQ